MNIAICDDNVDHIMQIKSYLCDMGMNLNDVDSFINGEALLNKYNETKMPYDVILMDMEMGHLNGIETANLIRKYDNNVLIVFVTNHSKYMEKCFECSPFDFLLKPVRFEKFKDVFSKIFVKVSEEPKFFVFMENRDKIRIPCNDVMYFEVQKHSLLIYKIDGTIHKIRKTLSDLLEEVEPKKFVQVHRSYIVNLSHIYKVTENRIFIHNNNNYIPLSSTYKKELHDAFIAYRERRYFI